MSRHLVPLFVLLSLLLGSCSGEDYYFESLSYTIAASSQGTAYECGLEFVSLDPGLSSVDILVPYARGEISSGPVVMLGKAEIKPTITELDNGLLLCMEFSQMKVGQMESIELRYVVSEGTDLRPGSRIRVRTLGLGGNATLHALSLKLPDGLTVSKVETPQGTVKAGGAGGVPLDLGQEPVELVFVLRRVTPLDNPYVSWGIGLGCVAIVAGFLLYRMYGRPRGKSG